jgi:2-methylcitrate dehydratase PrpD
VAWGLSRETLEHAFGLCGSMAAGSLQFLENGAWNKRLHVGTAAHNGILAMRFAANGVIGASHPIEGTSGFLRGYTDAPRPERITEAMGERWEIAETAIKPYPACRFTHSPIDSLVALVTEENLAPREIEAITVGLAAKGLDLVGLPAEHKKNPESVVDGQFSMHWTAAVAALRRGLTWADYALVRDPVVLDLVRRTEVVVDPASEKAYPDHFASTVRVRARGREYTRFALDPRGEPHLALTWDDMVAKFHGLAEAALGAGRRDEIVAAVRGLPALSKVGDLTALLRG